MYTIQRIRITCLTRKNNIFYLPVQNFMNLFLYFQHSIDYHL